MKTNRLTKLIFNSLNLRTPKDKWIADVSTLVAQQFIDKETNKDPYEELQIQVSIPEIRE